MERKHEFNDNKFDDVSEKHLVARLFGQTFDFEERGGSIGLCVAVLISPFTLAAAQMTLRQLQVGPTVLFSLAKASDCSLRAKHDM